MDFDSFYPIVVRMVSERVKIYAEYETLFLIFIIVLLFASLRASSYLSSVNDHLVSKIRRYHFESLAFSSV